ncbi:MAG: hypothetical protein U1U88_001602 [Lawsonella clevelandensis]
MGAVNATATLAAVLVRYPLVAPPPPLRPLGQVHRLVDARRSTGMHLVDWATATAWPLLSALPRLHRIRPGDDPLGEPVGNTGGTTPGPPTFPPSGLRARCSSPNLPSLSPPPWWLPRA